LARKILLADDSVTAQNMGRKILADAGYEVITVNNGSAALKKIAEQKPDLIILDVYMPGYSGLEVCQRLKEAQETARVPVLLTVGKLEPFKPEEAKRVRADAFIVKPFEASELLSALSKLEDKIVPRAEASKPGRFARATAALDEGRYDKTVAIDDEDSGWKNRISFPSKKKGKAAPEDGDDPAVYNAVNKDLRTVVEPKRADEPRAAVEETRVDLRALAPEGLPKDVTAEEIAALAAAAAQVKGKMAESIPADIAPAQAGTEPKVAASEPIQPVAELPREVAHEVPNHEVPKESPQEITAAAPALATFAEQKSEEKSLEKIETTQKSGDASGEVTPNSADIMAAIADLEVEACASPNANSGNASWLHDAPDRPADEPVTMAAAAGAGTVSLASRWTAVSVAVAPDEAAMSLELEMQKAYAAFAAAEAGHAAPASTETKSVPAEPVSATEITSQAEAASPEPGATIPAIAAPEATQSLSAVASAATDAISAAVQELEAVAASYVAQQAPTPAPAELESASAEKAEAASTVVPEGSPTEASPTAKAEELPNAPTLETAQPEAPEIRSEESKSDVPVPEETSGSISNQAPEQTSASQISEVAAESAGQPAASGTGDSVTKESDMAETTAAAWATWRQIRESGAPRDASLDPSEKKADEMSSTPQDAAAMAVAAGAEKTPEQSSPASEPEPENIANIVDSVLADLRPKIFEEITRKMGKNK
jgi:CheY-like chemotaxis protein